MGEDGVITFDNLYESLRLEKYKPELQKLDNKFFNKILEYLEDKKNILKNQESKDSVFASDSIIKTKRQLENTKMIIKEIYEKREAKIINLALFNSRSAGSVQDTEALLDHERDMYNFLVSGLNSFRINVLLNILECRSPAKVKEQIAENIEEKNNELIRFTESVPKFLGDDMNVYGPYQNEDMANLPSRVAEILVKNKRAEKI